MTQKIRLSESQKKVIRAMRNGKELVPTHSQTMYGSFTVYANHVIVNALNVQGLIGVRYELTDLGKNISLD